MMQADGASTSYTSWKSTSSSELQSLESVLKTSSSGVIDSLMPWHCTPVSTSSNVAICQKDVRIHQCPHCDYATPRSSNYKDHLRTHTGDKPFTCPHCGVRAGHISNLRRHVKRMHPQSDPLAKLN